MAKLEGGQSDAVLDIVEQCRVVTAAFHQKAAFERTGGATIEKDRRETVETEIASAYKIAIGYLTDLYVKASEELAIDDDTLCNVLFECLPRELDLTIGVVTS